MRWTRMRICHRADGPGGPENSDLAGLPKSYIIRQMADYRSGARGTSVAGRTPTTLMLGLSNILPTPKWKLRPPTFRPCRRASASRWSRAIPRPRPMWRACCGPRRKAASANRSGPRVVEVPDDLIRFESRDPRSTFTAYVPPGSLARGEALVMHGEPGKTPNARRATAPT